MSTREGEQEGRSSDRATAPRDRALVAVGLVFVLVVLVRSAWICDDALISFRTIDHFVNGEGLRWNLAERVQAFTHPLWLFVLTPIYALSREAFYTPIAISLLVSLAALVLLVFRASPASALVLLGCLAASKAFVDYSTSGLENPLAHLVFAAFLVTSFEDRPAGQRLVRQVGLATLLYLTRPDAILLTLPSLGVALVRVRRESVDLRWLRDAALATGPLIAWLAFSLFYYGSLVPNTAHAKLATGIDASRLAEHGLVYLASLSHYDPASALLLVAGLCAAFFDRRLAPLCAGILLHLAYVVAVGGDFMAGRFVSVTLLGASFLVARLARPSSRLSSRLRWLGPGVAVAALVLCLTSPYSSIRSGESYEQRDEVVILRWQGVADERGFYFQDRGLIAPGADHDLRPGSACREERRSTVQLRGHCGGLGFDGFTACPETHLVDICALTDPLLARLPAINRMRFRTGHYLRRPPEGYLESLRSGENRIVDPALHALYEDVRKATRAPLFAGGRASAIARLISARTAPESR